MVSIRQFIIDVRRKKSLLLLLIFAFISLCVITFAIYLRITDPDMTSETFTTLIIAGILIFAFPYGLYSYRKFYIVKGKEKQIPNLLRHLAEATRTGMSLPQALSNAARTDYGYLNEDVKIMASQLSWGVPFPKVIELFIERSKDSPFIQQTMSIIIEAYRSGGDIADTMDAVSKDAELIKELEEEQKAKMSAQVAIMYVIHFIFLVIILVLTNILKPLLMIQKSSGLASFFGKESSKVLTTASFRELFYNMCIIEGIYNGLIAGEIGEGSLLAGLKHVFIMLGASILMFIFLIKTEPMEMSQLNLGSYYLPDQEITLESVVTYSDGSQVSNAEVGATFYCINVKNCEKGKPACDINPECGMCYCTRTDDYGKFKFTLHAPIDAGRYKLKVVIKDTMNTKARISDTAELTVG